MLNLSKIGGILLIAVSAFVFVSCGSKSSKETSSAVQITEEPPVIEEANDLSDHPGLPVYNQHCLPCHQADGNGVPGMYPPIIDTKWVNGDDAELIRIVLHGMDEEIEVNGEIYNTIMAPLPHLTDQEVSDVLNYVRIKFGSSTEKITPSEVAAERESEG